MPRLSRLELGAVKDGAVQGDIISIIELQIKQLL